MYKLLTLLILLCSTLTAQPPSRFYTKFGGNGIDVGYSAKQTLDGQYIIAGSTSSYGAGNTDVYLVKLDSMGQILWQKTFGGFANDVGKAVIQVADSGFVIAGYTSSFGAGGYDAYILRTDKNGILIWQKTYGGLDWDFATDLVRTPDGDLAVIGNTSSFGGGKKDGFILKYDFLGNLIWQKFMGGAEDDELKSIIITNDNFLASVGYTKSKGELNGDCYFAKYNLNGDTLFTKTFGGLFKDFANDLVQKINGDYVICGAKTYSMNGKTESLMFSLNQSGSLVWENHYIYDTNIDENFSSNCNANHLINFTAYIKNIVFSGLRTQEYIFLSQPGGWPYKANDSGDGEDDFCYSIESTKDNGFITVGTTNSYGSVNGDIYFVKRDTSLINYLSLVGIVDNELIKNNFQINYSRNNQIIVSSFNNEIINDIKVLSIDGKEIFNKKAINSDKFILEMIVYESALYLLEVKSKNRIYYYKFINSNY